MFPDTSMPPLQQIHLPLLESRGVEWFVKRLDLVHPLLSGNKYYKLKYNILQAKKEGKKRLLTFGGAFSNHLYAIAAASRMADLEVIGCIRGEITSPLNPTLSFAREMGMVFHPMTREEYRQKTSEELINALRRRYGDFYLVPEGGTNDLAIKGCREILGPSDRSFNTVCASLGTAGTLAGLLASCDKSQRVLGFSSLKGEFVRSDFRELLRRHRLSPEADWEIFTDYHAGGYAKHSTELLETMQRFFTATGIPLDPIYTGKMAFGIIDLLEKNYFAPGSRILMIHSGGLQGIDGFEWRWKKKLYPG
ncbi:1-aminocyclopropane-1-carboxylate deaminase [Lunatimonas lonarensis]|uniref:1-aminocyclopropane-1-carboxylate deaminase n=1 Tax=Lunatimonas lonarensis TaxID=1232681 RepID=R7ZNQ2_9BACT|nr:pyridoxal-phosphate dependent enzyme [Lunatimonas lonarensis]EON75683.1 1-aminocyclopropane-1-carboxylate deaminase [Lunatimonas lonarensis]